MKIDLHTHILPRDWPNLRERYGCGGDLRWAIAGRSADKLEALKNSLGDEGVHAITAGLVALGLLEGDPASAYVFRYSDVRDPQDTASADVLLDPGFTVFSSADGSLLDGAQVLSPSGADRPAAASGLPRTPGPT